ncbi:MAG: AAA family ATPase [Rhodothermales bacterium]
MSTYSSIESLLEGLRTHQYISERGLATTLFLSLEMNRPLFLEGEAGVGKTEIAKVLAKMLDTRLIRLQCYEGLDINSAVYEWNYARQMLQIRLLEAEKQLDNTSIQQEIFGDAYLIKRPLLQSLQTDKPVVLLIDELDRADEEFEAFLLEILSDFQITIPEIGTIKAKHPPRVIITSNRTREIHDALKRRCLYHWVDYPSYQKELEIIQTKVPELPAALAEEVVAFLHELRSTDLYKQPGVAETIDWARALMALAQDRLDHAVVDDTLGILLKYHDDITKVAGVHSSALLEQARLKLAELGS